MGEQLMKQKRQTKIIIDIIMSVALLFLMAYQVTGDLYHEIIGAGMLVLFIIHNILNWKWYSTLFVGKYTIQRALRVLINVLVLLAIILTGYSGIVMSRHVFAFLPITSGLVLARKLHLSCSYWAFVLMSVHLGMHWAMVTRHMKDMKPAVLWILRVAALLFAEYGAYLFGKADIYSYMFMESEFAMLDYEKAGALVILEQLIMMSSWVSVGHFLIQGTDRTKVFARTSEEGHRQKKKAVFHKCINIALAVILIGISVISMNVNQSAESTDGWGGVQMNFR